MSPIVKEVLGALLMNNVEQRATRDLDDHDDDVRLHDDGWYGGRKLGERIAVEHKITPELGSYGPTPIYAVFLRDYDFPNQRNLSGVF